MKRDNVGTIRRKLKIYRGLFIATSVALLAFPVAVNGDFVKERYQILINGRSVGTAESKEAAQAAYEQARLELNAQSDALTLVDADVAYEPVKKRYCGSGMDSDRIGNRYLVKLADRSEKASQIFRKHQCDHRSGVLLQALP